MTLTRAAIHAASIALLVSQALAQDAGPAAAPADPRFLRGPEVQDRETPGVPSLFGEAMSPRDRVRMRPEQFLRLVRTLREDTVPASLRLSEDQQKTIAEAESEFTRARRAYMVEHLEEIRALRSATDERSAGAGAAQGRTAVAGAEREALLQKLRALQEEAPSFDEAQVRIWNLLTPAQQAHLEPEFQRIADEALERRAMQRLEALKTEGAGDAGALPPGALSDEALAKVRSILAAPPTQAERGLSVRDRINRRIDALPNDLVTPAQRERIRESALDRMNERRSDAAPPAA